MEQTRSLSFHSFDSSVPTRIFITDRTSGHRAIELLEQFDYAAVTLDVRQLCDSQVALTANQCVEIVDVTEMEKTVPEMMYQLERVQR